MSEKKVLISDLGGVVLLFDSSIAHRELAARAKTIEDDAKRVCDYWMIWAGMGRVGARGFWRKVCKDLGLSDMSYEEFHEIWTRIWTPNDKFIGTITAWKVSGRKCYLLSNIGAFEWSTIQSFREYFALFDALFFSYKIRIRKPNAAAYRAVCDAIGVLPSQCLFVDDLERNTEAARAVGMTAWRYDHHTHDLFLTYLSSRFF